MIQVYDIATGDLIPAEGPVAGPAARPASHAGRSAPTELQLRLQPMNAGPGLPRPDPLPACIVDLDLNALFGDA